MKPHLMSCFCKENNLENSHSTLEEKKNKLFNDGFVNIELMEDLEQCIENLVI